MSSRSLVGVDIGTSGAKALLLDAEGTVRASAFVEYPLSMPAQGWAEQDPEQWVDATIEAIRILLSDGAVIADTIAGLGFSGQMHGLVCLDADGRVLRPAILWCDTRTTRECRQIENNLGGPAEVLRHTFNSALEGFTLPKLLWVKNNEPEIYERVRQVLLPKDYIRFRLTGQLGMDLSDAAGTLLLDVGRQQWSQAVADAAGIDISLLPPLGQSSAIAGHITSRAASETGLPAGLPVVFGGADNACAAVGTGVVSQGMTAVSIGTSGTVIAPVTKPLHDDLGRVHTFLHAVPGTWYIMGVMQAAGLSLKWFRDTFGAPIDCNSEPESYDAFSAGTDQVSPGAEGLLWLPYLNGERTPHLDPNARGVLFGISPRHTKAHVTRAVMEGVAFGLLDSISIIEGMGIQIDSVRLTGGGGKSKVWRQILADVFQKPVSVLNVEEGPAFGAAIIAGVGTGVFPDFTTATAKTIQVVETTHPNPANAATYQHVYHRFNRLYQALKPEFPDN